MAGVAIVSAKEILGRRSLQTTLRYSHLDPRHLQEAVNRGSLIQTGIGTGTKTGSEAKIGDDVEKAGPVEAMNFTLEYLVRPAGIEPATLSLEG